MSLQLSADPFAFHCRLSAPRRHLEHAAWATHPDLRRIVAGVEHLALPEGEWALVDLTDRELRRLAVRSAPSLTDWRNLLALVLRSRCRRVLGRLGLIGPERQLAALRADLPTFERLRAALPRA